MALGRAGARGLARRHDRDTSGYDAAQQKDAPTHFAPIAFDQINPYTAECAYFADCILNHKPVEINDGLHALHIMQLVQMAYESARTGQRLAIKIRSKSAALY